MADIFEVHTKQSDQDFAHQMAQLGGSALITSQGKIFGLFTSALMEEDYTGHIVDMPPTTLREIVDLGEKLDDKVFVNLGSAASGYYRPANLETLVKKVLIGEREQRATMRRLSY
jgi:hypothetical protein